MRLKTWTIWKYFMYSYEDRIRAVKFYIKLGKHLKATICQLGYPTKNSLIRWSREYERSQNLRVGYSRSGRKYSNEQKQAAVKHYLDHDRAPQHSMCSGRTERIYNQI